MIKLVFHGFASLSFFSQERALGRKGGEKITEKLGSCAHDWMLVAVVVKTKAVG